MPLPNDDRVSRIVTKLTENALENALSDPLGVVYKAQSIGTLLEDFLPTFPWESPIPLPRKLYDRLMKSGVRFNNERQKSK